MGACNPHQLWPTVSQCPVFSRCLGTRKLIALGYTDTGEKQPVGSFVPKVCARGYQIKSNLFKLKFDTSVFSSHCPHKVGYALVYPLDYLSFPWLFSPLAIP